MTDTYHETYCKAYDKCEAARDAGRHYIEVRMHKDGYRLYAHTKPHGYGCFAKPADGIILWAERITNYIAEKGWCSFPLETADTGETE